MHAEEQQHQHTARLTVSNAAVLSVLNSIQTIQKAINWVPLRNMAFHQPAYVACCMQTPWCGDVCQDWQGQGGLTRWHGMCVSSPQ